LERSIPSQLEDTVRGFGSTGKWMTGGKTGDVGAGFISYWTIEDELI
jgi:hypothetical protein